jgi:proline dehydrogenase
VRDAIVGFPVTRRVVERFVAGESMESAVRAVRALRGGGLHATLDHLGEDTRDAAQATAIRDAYIELLTVLHRNGLAEWAEVSVKLSALGQALPDIGEKLALENARAICEAAAAAGTTVTLDMEDHTTVDSTLHILRELRQDFPWVAAVLQSMLLRTPQDCADLAHPESRVRLVKGAYAEPAQVAHSRKADVDAAYRQCARILMAGGAYPMIASHDSRMIAAGKRAARDARRQPGEYEFQMLYGIRTDLQRELVRKGEWVRVYVPFGTDWYGYFMRRLAERPANLAFFLRALLGR